MFGNNQENREYATGGMPTQEMQYGSPASWSNEQPTHPMVETAIAPVADHPVRLHTSSYAAAIGIEGGPTPQ